MGYYILYFLRYLGIRNERGHLAVLREGFVSLIFSAGLTAAIYLPDISNTFGDGGLVERVGAFTSVLSGFFVAALVAISAFSMENTTLDEVISVGKVYINENEDGPEFLTRRSYVCVMFGYLVGISLSLSAFSILSGSFSSGLKRALVEVDALIGWGISSDEIVFVLFLLSYLWLFVHMCLVALRGVYYLMDKIYEKKPTILPKRGGYDPTKRPPKGR